MHRGPTVPPPSHPATCRPPPSAAYGTPTGPRASSRRPPVALPRGAKRIAPERVSSTAVASVAATASTAAIATSGVTVTTVVAATTVATATSVVTATSGVTATSVVTVIAGETGIVTIASA